MIIRSTADAGLCCYQVIGIQLLEGVLLPDSFAVIVRELDKVLSTGQGGRARRDGYTMLSLALFPLSCVMCFMKKTGFFPWKSFEFLSSFFPSNSGLTLLLETKLIKDEMASLIYNRMTMTII